MRFQRDVIIDEIYDMARDDKDIYFLSADFGAPSLDRFREDLADQFLHVGISEQNMIDMAAGMALSGKKVYVYAMGPFITLRCLEQLKVSLAQMNLPVTVISVGLGLGYADAGPTHYATEALACLRSIVNCEVYTPSDTSTVVMLARLTDHKPAFRVLRLDRNSMKRIYDSDVSIEQGVHEIHSGERVGVFSCGYVLQRMWMSWAAMCDGANVGLVDVFCNKPINLEGIRPLLEKYESIITVEEQCLTGGFGSAILEAISDLGMNNSVKRLGLAERYYFENKGRDGLLDTFGLSNKTISAMIHSC